MKSLCNTFAVASIVSSVAGCTPSLSDKPLEEYADFARFKAYAESAPCDELSFPAKKKIAILKEEIADPATNQEAQLKCNDSMNNNTQRGEVSTADLCSITNAIRVELEFLESKGFIFTADFDNYSVPNRYEHLLRQQKNINHTIAHAQEMTRRDFREIISGLVRTHQHADWKNRRWCKD